jgi:hypothetical protein
MRALLVFVMAMVACSASTPTPAQQQMLTNEAAGIAQCQAQGRACKADGGTNCWDVYDSCMVDGGLR